MINACVVYELWQKVIFHPNIFNRKYVLLLCTFTQFILLDSSFTFIANGMSGIWLFYSRKQIFGSRSKQSSAVSCQRCQISKNVLNFSRQTSYNTCSLVHLFLVVERRIAAIHRLCFLEASVSLEKKNTSDR